MTIKQAMKRARKLDPKTSIGIIAEIWYHGNVTAIPNESTGFRIWHDRTKQHFEGSTVKQCMDKLEAFLVNEKADHQTQDIDNAVTF